MRRLGPVMALTLVIAACGGNDAVQIEDAWARASANMQNAGAVYLTISGGADGDRFLGVSVDDSIAQMAQIHQTTVTEADDGAEMMSMDPVEIVEIPARGEIVLEPGGYHIMLTGLAEPLVRGQQFDVTLVFEQAGSLDVAVEVRDG